jgi:hypothetical protein
MNLNTQSNIKKRRSRRGGRSLSISHPDKTDSNSVESRSQPPVELPVASSKNLEDPTDSDLDPDDVDKNNKNKESKFVICLKWKVLGALAWIEIYLCRLRNVLMLIYVLIWQITME